MPEGKVDSVRDVKIDGMLGGSFDEIEERAQGLEADGYDGRGEFYTHTLMTPFFDPGPKPHGPPKVMLAAVGDLMSEVAGEVADGMILHPFTTERYVREVTLPALERGFATSGRTRADFTL